MKSSQNFFSYRTRILILLVILIPVGLATKFYQGPGYNWVNHYAGGLVYEIFWCLVVSFIQPRLNGWTTAAWVFGITCLLECLQLWHPPFLELIRSTFWGKALIGTSFSWWDFPHYIFGSAIGGLLVEKLKK